MDKKQQLIFPLCIFAFFSILAFTPAGYEFDTFINDSVRMLTHKDLNKSLNEADGDLVSVRITDITFETIGKQNYKKIFPSEQNVVLDYCPASDDINEIFRQKRNPVINKLNNPSLPYALTVFPVEQDLYENGHGEVENTQEEQKLIEEKLWYPQVINGQHIPEAKKLLIPSEYYLKSATTLCFVQTESNFNNIIRKQPLFYKYKDGYLPCLALALAADKLQIDTHNITIDCGNKIYFKTLDGDFFEVPVDGKCCTDVSYIHNRVPTIDYATYVKALNDEFLYASIRNKVEHKTVLYTDCTTSRVDSICLTPVGLKMSKTEIQTQLYYDFVNKTFTKETPLYLKAVYLVLLLLLIFLSPMLQRDSTFSIATLIVTALVSVTQFFLWKFYLIVPWITNLLCIIFFTWASLLAQRHLYWKK